MKKQILVAAALVFAASNASAEPLLGMWSTAPDDNGNTGHILVEPCGDTLCGTLITAFDAQGNAFDSPNVGRQLIWDMKPRAGGTYGGGKVYSPDRDQTYAGKLKLDGDTLTVQGCVLVVCRDGGIWTRVQ